ncbi:hypothetical protein VTL71DRAFT_13570 [Oculimacula yallundae]|uniref:Uncharacterized protein n=1 Tax=Oculimacula yallundae TaxID=86028 RepID=A0ABR4CL98_9HELO
MDPMPFKAIDLPLNAGNDAICPDPKRLRYLPPGVGDYLATNSMSRPTWGSNDYNFDEDFTFEFIHRLMNLPKEVRDEIYELVIFKEDNWDDSDWEGIFMDNVGTQHDHIMGQRKLDGNLYRGVRIQEFPMTEMTKSDFQGLASFFSSIMKFEGRHRDGELVSFLQDPSKSKERELGLFKDVSEYFWRNSTIHVLPRVYFGFGRRITQIRQFTAPNPLLCSPLSHLAIRLYSLPRRRKYKSRNNWVNMHLGFIAVLHVLAVEFPNLLSLTLDINLSQTTLKDIIQNPKKQPWVRYVSKIAVKQVHFRIQPRSSFRRRSGLKSKQTEARGAVFEQAAKVLEDLLMPMSLRFPEDEDFGLERLFLEDES